MFKSTRLILFLVVAFLAGCTFPNVTTITGSGNEVTQEAAFTDYDKVDVSHAFRVNIKQGDDYSAVITIDDNLQQYLKVDKVGDTLKVGLDPAVIVGRATMRADITMPQLAALKLSGASRGAITGFESSNSFNSTLSGASRLEGDIQAGDTDLNAAGSVRIKLKGSGGDLTVDARGASGVDLEDFSVSDASVKASGASQVTVNASGTLNADASGSSTIYYLGDPTLGKVDTSGASSIKRK
jgi:hypothetical protein